MAVETWDEATGTALVVESQRGALCPVTDYQNFPHLERAGRWPLSQVVVGAPVERTNCPTGHS